MSAMMRLGTTIFCKRTVLIMWHFLIFVSTVNLQAHLIGCWQNLGAVCFWQFISSGLNFGCCCPAWQTVLYAVYRMGCVVCL